MRIPTPTEASPRPDSPNKPSAWPGEGLKVLLLPCTATGVLGLSQIAI